MPTLLTGREEEFVGLMEELEILMDLPDMNGLCKNGGVKCCCGDGHMDIITFHKAKVHPHANPFTPPGGPLNLSLSFLKNLYGIFFGFGEAELKVVRRFNVAAIKVYMMAKDTRSLFDTLHYPCGAAKKAGIDIKMMMTVNLPEIVEFVSQLFIKDPEYFQEEKTCYKIHLLKRRGGVEIQRTYIIKIPQLYKYMDTLKKFEL